MSRRKYSICAPVVIFPDVATALIADAIVDADVMQLSRWLKCIEVCHNNDFYDINDGDNDCSDSCSDDTNRYTIDDN